MYKHIMVPLDGSEFAESVLSHVEAIAPEGAGQTYSWRYCWLCYQKWRGFNYYCGAWTFWNKSLAPGKHGGAYSPFNMYSGINDTCPRLWNYCL